MRFQDIPQFTRDGHYQVNVSWDFLETHLAHLNEGQKLDLNPDFQRGHVWNESKQRAFVEFCLKGGRGSSLLRFNCPGWMKDFRGPMVLVDGKQRLEAVRKFMRNELAIFDGHKFGDFTDRLRMTTADFIFMVNDLDTRKEVLQWYLDINSGGVVHTQKELDKVRSLLSLEK